MEAIGVFVRPTADDEHTVMLQTTELINQLAVRHRAPTAYRTLFAMGFAVVPVVLAGLRHESAAVRNYCCKLLDHFLVSEALGDVLGMLHDADPLVRQSALHTLACDRCKQGACRPIEAEVLPEALRLLREDGDPHVRAMAIEVVGQYVHTNPIAERALVDANTNDRSPAVRKKASWYRPGGPIHTRTAPRAARKA